MSLNLKNQAHTSLHSKRRPEDQFDYRLLHQKQRLTMKIMGHRIQNKISQEVLARKLNMTRARLSQLENAGNISGTRTNSLESLLSVLTELGYRFTISLEKID